MERYNCQCIMVDSFLIVINYSDCPPSAVISCPVMASCCNTEQIRLAISSGAAICCSKIWPAKRYTASSRPSHPLVATAPGTTLHTLISGARARANDFVKPCTAALETAYGSDDPKPVKPATLPTLTIAPCLFAFI